jgi:mono/diheme cytochrome c family protein
MNQSLSHSVVCRLLPLLVLLMPACQQEMAVQPSVRPFDESGFFPDGRAARPVVAGTVARGHLHTDSHLFAGTWTLHVPGVGLPAALIGNAPQGLLGAVAMALTEEEDFVDTFPFPITEEIVRHGQDRYRIYCVVCHDPLGTGRGKIVERGYTAPPSYHIERLRKVAVGHIFNVITHGYGSMPEYRAQISPRDRWAITAYVRALQYSQHFPDTELTPEMRQA